MKVSVDGGGLCAHPTHRFGNFTFTTNILHALYQYDTLNNYTIYTFCKRELSERKGFSYARLLPRQWWMRVRVPFEEWMRQNDIFLALNQALPLNTPARIITLSHGLSFYYFPRAYPTQYWYLRNQLKQYVSRSSFIVTSSTQVSEELRTIYRSSMIDHRLITIPFGIPFDFVEYKRLQRKKFFLFVGMHTPIKNIDFLIDCFKKFRRYKEFASYKFVLVGSSHSYSDPNIFTVSSLDRSELRKLYATATAYLTSSLYESFNFPVLEAAAQHCPVIGLQSAIIPELRKYSHTVKNKKEFIEKMIEAARSELRTTNYEHLHVEFSWESYVKKLTTLYTM